MITYLIIWQFLCMTLVYSHNRCAPWARLLLALFFAGLTVPWAFAGAMVDTWRTRR